MRQIQNEYFINFSYSQRGRDYYSEGCPRGGITYESAGWKSGDIGWAAEHKIYIKAKDVEEVIKKIKKIYQISDENKENIFINQNYKFRLNDINKL